MLRFSLTTALITTGAVLVIYTRLKNWVDTNIPVFFFTILVAHATLARDPVIPARLTYAGLAVSTLLRFEFMNVPFTRLFKAAEICITIGVLYVCTLWFMGR